MSSSEVPSNEISQNVQAENSGVAFVQGSGVQNNHVVHNHLGGAYLNPEELFRRGVDHLRGRHYEKAEAYLTAAAEAGHMEAMRSLAPLERNGPYVGAWTRKLAELGDAQALYDVGCTAHYELELNDYRINFGGRKHLIEALESFEKALAAGHEGALLHLGFIYYKVGEYRDAIPYLEKAVQFLKREGRLDEQQLWAKLKHSQSKVARQQKEAARKAARERRDRDTLHWRPFKRR
ncbi:tetratricopeptide repeat protein [Streptomyces anulatus]|uniref:tetratricopeptide repeat protein n=1 Tax=Streptomyces anulatus TaxID=1892 RepID=UPI0035DDE69D